MVVVGATEALEQARDVIPSLPAPDTDTMSYPAERVVTLHVNNLTPKQWGGYYMVPFEVKEAGKLVSEVSIAYATYQSPLLDFGSTPARYWRHGRTQCRLYVPWDHSQWNRSSQ